MTSYLLSAIPHALPSIEHVLAVRGAGGYRQYRIPALAVTVKGTLLAAYDGRPNLDDLPSPIDLLIRRSEDCGRSWGPQQVVRTGTGLSGYGDSSVLVDTETGRIFLFHAAGTRAGFFEASTSGDPDDDGAQHCDLSFSDDDGLTWQHRRITGQLKGGGGRGITGIFAAAGQGIQIHTGPFRGRLVQQYVILCEGRIMAASAFSDDHGNTWTLGESIEAAPGGPAPNENKVAALSDGRLLLHSRATPHRLAAVSDDGGRSWSSLSPVEDLPDPSDNGSLLRFDGLPNVPGLATAATDTWLLATNNHDTSLRRNTVISLSPDNGSTWPAKLVLYEGSSAYSTAARLPDGNIGVLYERQGYREIVFASAPTEQLTRQLSASRTPDRESGQQGQSLIFHMELRSITPGLPTEWQNTGEFHVLVPDGKAWGAESWKEIGQGYSPDQAQVLGTREAQDLNYGPIIPGYKAGDILAFTGRARNNGTEAVAGVRLSGPGADAFPELTLLPGEEAPYFTPTYTVTRDDVNRGEFTVIFTLSANRDSEPKHLKRIFAFDASTGEVREGSAP